MRVLILLILSFCFFFVSTASAGEKEALALFQKRLDQIPPTQEAVLQTLGKPRARFADPPALRRNLQKALQLAPKGERTLLDSELHPSVLKSGGATLNDLDQPAILDQIAEVWTYDYAGRGKWASFLGVYFNQEKKVLGWDWLIPEEEPPKRSEPVFLREKPASHWEFWATAVARPLNWIRGIKQASLEVGRAPADFLEVSWFLGPEEGWEAAVQNFHAAGALLEYFIFNPAKQNLAASFRNLVAEIPILGSFLDDPLPQNISSECDAYFLLGGIHQVSDQAQRMDPLEQYLKKRLNTERVYRVPWNHGTMLDVSFGTLNLSHGDSLLIAQEIVRRGRLKKGDRIALFAHSGAIQEVIGVARFLRDEGIYVPQAVGVAGVCVAGKAPVRDFEIFYDPDQDQLKWALGFKPLTPGIRWRRISGKSLGKQHEISGSLDKRTRLLYDGYFEEIGRFFAERRSLSKKGYATLIKNGE